MPPTEPDRGQELVTELRRRGVPEAYADPSRRAQYASDASIYRRPPLAVVFPRNRTEIVTTVAVCRELEITVTCRGAGTSTSGQAVGSGAVLDLSRHCHRLLELDPERRVARVEPGLVLDALQSAAAPYGLRFGPDPSTHSRATIGGMIGNNACGSHSVVWGRTSDNVLELEVLTYRGAVLTVGPMDQAEIDAAVTAGGEGGELVARLAALARANLATLRTRFDRFPRQVSGYGLAELLPERRFDLARALVGSEGTCAVVLSATVRLVPVPAHRGLVVLGFADAIAAAAAVPALIGRPGLQALEGLDRALTDIVVRAETRRTIATLPAGDAWLFAELGGAPDEVAERSRELVADAARHDGHRGHEIVADPVRAAGLWRIREDGAGLATRLPDGSEAWPGWEDAAVPPAALADYLRDFTALRDRFGYSGPVYGHFGEGCLHVRIDFDFATHEGVARFREFVTEAARLVTRHGGSLSGEHGDGRSRSELLALMYPREVLDLFAAFKVAWDPDGGLNPGVITDPRPLDSDLRVDPARRSLPLATVLPFHADGGDLDRATRRCVGVGKCRSAEPRGGVMCPSYRATGDERDSTRGRARVLYEMTQGEVITAGWRSTEVRDALDLCLSCKGCSSDCPVGVDIASYKSEFLHHHYRGRVRPASHYSMGWLPALSRVAALAPRLANRVLGSRLAPVLKRAGGIAPERQLPRFAARTFLAEFAERTPRGAGERGPVLLWVDSFDNHFSPEVLHAGVAVLEDAGYRVEVPPGVQCCGLTWMTTGQLGVARRVMARTLRSLAGALAQGAPIVGLEPSCTAALRTDLPELLDGDPAARRLAGAVRTFAEQLQEHTPGWTPPRVAGSAVSQTHCHQHATVGFGADAGLLAAAGVDNRVLDTGCCGLAGNFGFERGHYEVSRTIAEQGLLPEVRAAAPDTAVLADGFSCRTQIAQAGDRRAIHLAQLLASGLAE
ncbi:FAD-binding and (Fe-S)-binding domain-containing protein [Pseudonocardia oroxyli]|uniref:FAD/FMN-containing dehydrogenase n=1 Tax=Pseudonocardia oroxyli TaxID=366584 RepID=A0A1G7STJ2_PSEOR|nr:FAD-binding and (Fe-S)-binding domain-containing protein [Pseudonocardia oroxyli]SDG26104.1 FAD/FMN-containing dehydrogenase [Pseudonocardia oroxyli]